MKASELEKLIEKVVYRIMREKFCDIEQEEETIIKNESTQRSQHKIVKGNTEQVQERRSVKINGVSDSITNNLFNKNYSNIIKKMED